MILNPERYQAILAWLDAGWPLVNDQLHDHDRETLAQLLRRAEAIATRRLDELLETAKGEAREAAH